MNITGIIATVLLVLMVLSYFAYQVYAYYQSPTYGKWPPIVANCPDYFTELKVGECKNTFNIGTCPKDTNGNKVDYGIMKFTEKTTLKEKCQQAKACGLTWDGIMAEC